MPGVFLKAKLQYEAENTPLISSHFISNFQGDAWCGQRRARRQRSMRDKRQGDNHRGAGQQRWTGKADAHGGSEED